MTPANRIPTALLLLRLSIFLVILMWTLDKFVNPDHAAAVFEGFYGLADIGENIIYVLGSLELLLLIAFVTGFKKRFSYGLVTLLHAVSTFSSYGQYLDPWPNLLFFAAWPMLAACVTLYLLRDLDTRWTVSQP